jgi:SsrA-binding protein
MSEQSIKNITKNRKAEHDYFLTERLEAGIVLRGTEIKSIRARNVSLREAYVQTDGREAWLQNAYIAPYDPASHFNHDPRRSRKLLLHRREIQRLADKTRQKGFTIIPTRLYLKGGIAKVEIALARGKRQYDKRRELAKKDAEREMARAARRRGEA